MKQNFVCILAFLILGPGSLFGNGLVVKNISCDYQHAPMGIDKRSPRLGWEISCEGKRNVMQSAYHIMVASSKDLLDADEADMWDTGEILSDNSIQVSYEGKELISGKRYFWKVRIRDKSGALSPFSEPSIFEMALLEEEDWKAKWISAPSVASWPRFLQERGRKTEKDKSPWEEGSPLFRKEFSLKSDIASARMYVSGLGYYEAFMNGEKVGDHQLDPVFTRYDKTVMYAVYDVGSMLKENNTIGIMLGNGWYNMFTSAVWGFDHAPWRGKPRVIMQVEVLYEDGSREMITSDDSWKTSPGPLTFNSVRQGVVHDARLEQEGWNTNGFDDGKWEHVFIVPTPGGELRAQTMEPIRAITELSPVNIERKKDGRYILDFGRNMAGWSRVIVKGQRGDTLTLKYGEALVGDSVYQDNVDHFIDGFAQVDRFILAGEESDTFETKFSYHGFQYIEVSGFPGELTEESISAIVANTDFRTRGVFECSNEIINKTQQNTLRSFLSNYHGYPTDCPQREKNGWTGDAQVAVETGLWNFHSNTAYAKYVQDMTDEQRADGNLPAIIPGSQWGYYNYNGPDWVGAYLIIPWQMYLFDGDVETLEKHYGGMKRLHAYYTGIAEDHIVSTGLGDHTYDRSKRVVPLTSTAYYYMFSEILARTSELLGMEEDQEYFSELSAGIKKAFNAKFYDPATGIYGNGTQTNQSCPIFFGLVEDEEKEKVVNKLAEMVRDNGGNIDAGILGAKYVPHALSENGYAELAYQMIIDEDFPGWGWWVKQGATTLWEQWDGLPEGSNASLNHIMFGDVSNWFYQNIAGIRPDQDAPGFKHFFVEPRLTEQLDWSHASYESPYGLIKLDWRKEGAKLYLEVDVPCDTSATVSLPAQSEKEIREGGRSLKNRKIEPISGKPGHISLDLGSGSYSFEIE